MYKWESFLSSINHHQKAPCEAPRKPPPRAIQFLEQLHLDTSIKNQEEPQILFKHTHTMEEQTMEE